MAEVSGSELIDLAAHALHHDGPPGNAEPIDMRLAAARARVLVRELVEREGLVFTRPMPADAAPATQRATR